MIQHVIHSHQIFWFSQNCHAPQTENSCCDAGDSFKRKAYQNNIEAGFASALAAAFVEVRIFPLQNFLTYGAGAILTYCPCSHLYMRFVRTALDTTPTVLFPVPRRVHAMGK